MLYGFGDSFTQGCYEGGFVEPYLNHIGKKLNTEVTNRARYGMSFEEITATIVKTLPDIKKGDTVIYGGTIIDRIMFPVPYEQVFDYHGTSKDKSLYSISGFNPSSLEFFFEMFDEQKRKKMGYKYSFNDYAKLIMDYDTLLKIPFSRAYRKFYDDMFLHWNSYFKSIDVSFYWWRFDWWFQAPEEDRGTCGHWNAKYHKEFADILGNFIENNKSGCLDSNI